MTNRSDERAAWTEIYGKRQRFSPATKQAEIDAAFAGLERRLASSDFNGGSELPALASKTPPEPRIATDQPTKYRNVKTGGYSSKREAKRAEELKLLAASGEITQLIEQPKFLLIPKQEGERACFYIADFEYKNSVGARCVEDVKGCRTPVYILKRKLLLFVHGIRITEI